MGSVASPCRSRSVGRGGRRGAGPASAALLTSTTSGAAGERAGEPRRLERFEIGGARQVRVDRLELAGGLQQERGRLAAALHANAICARSRSTRARWSRRAPPVSAVARSARASSSAPASYFVCAAASARCARRDGSGVSAAARSRKAAAAARPPRAWARPAARSSSRGDVLVGAGRRPARCQARRSGSTSASVASASARCTSRRCSRRCRPVDRRAHERMAKAHPAVDLDQPGAPRPARAPRPVIPSRSAARHSKRRIADRLGRGDQQQPPGVLGQRLEPLQEALLDPALERERAAATRSRPPAARPTARAAARAAPAGCRASRRRAGRRPARPAAPGSPRPAASRASASSSPSTTSSGRPVELVARLARGEQHARPTPPAACAPRTPTPARRLGPAIARRRSRTAAGAPAPPRRAGSSVARPTRNRSGTAPALSPNVVASASRCGAGSRSSRSSSGAHS